MGECVQSNDKVDHHINVVSYIVGCLYFCANELEKMGYTSVSVSLMVSIETINSNIKTKLN